MEKKDSSGKDDESFLDFGRIKNLAGIVMSNKEVFLILLLLIIPMVLSIHFRVTSAYLPVADDWARVSVYNGIRGNIAGQVNQRYPNLPPQNKLELVEQQFQRLLGEQGPAIDQQIEAGAAHFRSRMQDQNGQTYLLAIDPYQWYRRARNWDETGHWYDELRDGVPWNTHMRAPFGIEMSPALHVSATYWTYKLVSLFNPNIPLLTVLFYIPVLFAAVSVIPAFFLARKKAGNFGGFIAAMIVGVHTTFLSRTAGGFSDTDAYSVFFPLLITWLFVEAFEAKNLKKRILLTSLAGFSTGLFAFAWNGWWYIFDFLLVVLIAYAGYSILRQILMHKYDLRKIITSEDVVNTFTVGILFIIVSGIFVTYFLSLSVFLQAPLEPIKFRIIKNAAHANLWPNVFTTVAELGNTGLSTIVRSIGGKLMFFIASLGVILTMTGGGSKGWKKDSVLVGASAVLLMLLVTDKFLGLSPFKFLITLAIPLGIGLFLTLKDDRNIDVKYAMFLTVWFAGTIYASTKGIRFILLLVPAFAVAFGVSLGMIKELIARWVKKGLNIKTEQIAPVIMIMLLFFLIAPIKQAAGVGKNEVPSMNDAWWDSLEQIKQNSQEDAIINSWWDFGHWFKAIADRKVTFDGASQNSPMAHWIGRALLTSDEKTAVGILRLMDCGSNGAFVALNPHYNNDTVTTVDLLYELILLDREGARERLVQEELSQEKIEEVLELSHCDPPENFFITSEDMVGKAGVWAHFGSWDFKKAYIYSNLRNSDPEEAVRVMQEKFGYDEEHARSTYYEMISLQSENQANAWISPWPNYVLQRWSGCTNTTEDIITCNMNVRISQQGGQQVVLERIVVDLSNLQNSTIYFGGFDVNSGARLGGGEGRANGVAIADGKNIVRTKLENTTFSYDVLINTNGPPKVLILHPMFTESMFTKLFYLGGVYNEHFEQFSDRSGVNGQRILVWKVDWEGS